MSYKRSFKKYREFIESFPDWATTFCGLGYDSFVMLCESKPKFRDRWVVNEIKPYKELKKHELPLIKEQ